MAAIPKKETAAREGHGRRRKLPFHSLRGLTLTQEEADQLDPSLSRPAKKDGKDAEVAHAAQRRDGSG